MSELDDLRKQNAELKAQVARYEHWCLHEANRRKDMEDVHQLFFVMRFSDSEVSRRHGEMYQSCFISNRLQESIADSWMIVEHTIGKVCKRFFLEFEERQVKLGLVPHVPPGDPRMVACDARLAQMNAEGRVEGVKADIRRAMQLDWREPYEAAEAYDIVRKALDR